MRMRNFLAGKKITIIIGLIAMFLLIILVSGIDSLRFSADIPFEYAQAEASEEIGSLEPPSLEWVSIFGVGILAVLTILMLVVATPKQRKVILLVLGSLLLVTLFIMWGISRGNTGIANYQPPAAAVHTEVPDEATAEVMPTLGNVVIYEPPAISPWISIGITFATLTALAGIGWVVLRNRWRNDANFASLAGIADRAVSQLRAGKDYGDVIINCYAGMVEEVNQRRGIRRRGNLTPDEFVAVLSRGGIPVSPARRLTTLFTRIRYGAKESSQKDIDEAIDCLNEIVNAIRGDQ